MITALLMDIGSSRVTRSVSVKNENALYKEIGKHLFSKGWGLDETEDPNLWEVTAGFRTVGLVKIIPEHIGLSDIAFETGQG